MKLHLTQAEGKHLITGHGPGWVKVNTEHYSSSLIVLPDQLIENWPADSPRNLTPELFSDIAHIRPEVLLIGTGLKLFFPPSSCMQHVIDAGFGYEIMDTAAACRTFNILMSEGRNVAAALIIEPN